MSIRFLEILFEVDTTQPTPTSEIKTIIQDGAEANGYTFEELSIDKASLGVEKAYKLEPV